MTAVDASVLVILVIGAIAALVWEVRLALDHHPRRFRLAWSAWTPLASLEFGYMLFNVDGALAGLFGFLVVGPLAYPAARAAFWLNNSSYRQAEEAALERERLRYRPTDFGPLEAADVWQPAASARANTLSAAPLTDAPLAVRPANVALAKLTAGRRSRLGNAAELLVISLVGAAGLLLWGISAFGIGTVDRTEAVGAALELQGYVGARLEPDTRGPDCLGRRTAAYRWSAPGAQGRACADGGGHVELWVDRRWMPDPSLRTSDQRRSAQPYGAR